MFPKEPVPETIGAYRVLRPLADTGAARAYLGRLEGPLGFQRTCALKLVPNTAGSDAQIAQELAREATICSQLNHPAIVRMFDFFEEGDKLVLVLEHVEGASLDRLLQHIGKRRQKLGDPAAYHVAYRIAGALAHAHAMRDEHGALTPVIHRNLHPESILIGWDGQVRLTGFGLAKILGRTPDTVVGAARGVLGTRAPELLRGERPTVKTDVYGLGLLLWSLLAGRKPPAEGTRPGAMSILRPDVPRPIAVLIDAALAPFPEARTTSCQELEETLAKVGRAEEGKAELVLRIQSAHSSLELEESDANEARRTTIRVMAASKPTLRPAGSPEAAAKAPRPVEPRKIATQAQEATPVKAAPVKAAPGKAAPGKAAPGKAALEEAAPESIAPEEAAPESIAPEDISLEDAEEDEPTRAFRARPAVLTAGTTLTSAGLQPGPMPATPEDLPPVVPRFGTPPPPPPGAVFPGIHFGSPPAPRLLSPPLADAPPVAFGSPPLADAPPVAFGSPPLADAPPVFAPEPPVLPGPGTIPGGVVGFGPSLARWLGQRTLSPRSTIAISAVAVTVIATAWIYLAYRDPSPPEAASPTEPTATASVAGAPTPPPGPLATPAAASAPPASLDPDALPTGFGYLTVTFPAPAHVHVNGKYAGAANEPLTTRCGRWFVRVAKPGEARFPEWVSAGVTVSVACQGSTTAEVKPLPGRVPSPRR